MSFPLKMAFSVHIMILKIVFSEVGILGMWGHDSRECESEIKLIILDVKYLPQILRGNQFFDLLFPLCNKKVQNFE